MNELYHQMTLDEWAASKKRIHEMVRTAKAAFIVIGYELRKIEQSEAYKMDGYATLAEFAKAEYGFEKTMTSRLIDVNRTFSEGGFSDVLIEDAQGFTFSKLVEMKDLPPEDLQLITPGTKRDDIRELKRFEAEDAGGREDNGLDSFLTAFFEKEKDVLNELFGRMSGKDLTGEEIAEIVSPTGSRAFRKGLWMAFFNADSIMLKKKTGEVLEWSYEDLIAAVMRIFGQAAAGWKTWEAFFGAAPESGESGQTEPESAQEKQESDTETTESVQIEAESVRKKQEAVKHEPESTEESKEEDTGNRPKNQQEDPATAAGHEESVDPDKGERGEIDEPAEYDGEGREEIVSPELEGDRDASEGGGEGEGKGSEDDLPGEECNRENDSLKSGSDTVTFKSEAVAPAQQETGKTTDETGRHELINFLAEEIDTLTDKLSGDVGAGRYVAALAITEKLLGKLKEMTGLVEGDHT